MSVEELLEYMGDVPLAEMTFRVALANDLNKSLDEVRSIPEPEMADWMLLYDVEQEYAQQQAENERRR